VTSNESAPFTVREIDHVVLRVIDLDAMLRFYRDALGCRVERSLDIGLVQLRAGRSMIDLVPVASRLGEAGGAAPGREGRNLDHFCVRIEPFDEAAIRDRLGAMGFAPGPTESRYGAEGEGPSIYVGDPEGNVVELKGPPTRAGMPYLGLLGVGLREDDAVCSLRVGPQHLNSAGIVHGGVLFSLADSAMGYALYRRLDAGLWCSTVDARIGYVKPVRIGAELACRGEVVSLGRTIAHVEAIVTSGEATVARAQGVFAVLQGDEARG
jgi:uncharacterized protein (TIGR00369 family)